MFIFPILKNNELAKRLNHHVEEYWIKKFSDKKYVKSIREKYDDYNEHNKSDLKLKYFRD